ncbi:MAG: Hsp33 family molecular chaperone HslO [Halieaceae bacterium]|jgi:molecular chaperone Hsp33|nr:Hsp33 family molecular chaperone HslO [Halieaceae bacterium]
MKDIEHDCEQSSGDLARRFLFEEADIRGESVRLETSYRDMLAIHQYAPGVSQLLGELLAAAVLLRSTLKFEGKLILQARSQGQIPLLMAECSSSGELRGIARGADLATANHFSQLLGQGSLAITVDPMDGQRYQGIVPLAGDSLAHSLDAYFAQSEQLGTRFWLAADGERAAGLLLQQLPAQLTLEAGARAQQWEHACTLAATIQGEELLELSAESLLFRLFHQDAVRLFTPSPVQFHCSCSRERTLRGLSAIAPVELDALLQELGCITMDCEFCNQQYVYQREDLGDVLGQGPTQILH